MSDSVVEFWKKYQNYKTLLHCAGARWREFLLRHENVLFSIGIALAMRLVLSALGAWIVVASSHVIQPKFETQWHGLSPLDPVGVNLLAAPFQRWDAVWYELIAARGYSANDMSAAFSPLFPLITRLLTFGSGSTALVEVGVGTVCTAAAFVLFYRITESLFDKRAARVGLVAWAVFPPSFFLFVPYAEGLFVLCALASLQAARHKRWFKAGFVGGLVALSRSPGVWIIVPLGIEWLNSARTQRWKTSLQAALPLGLVPLAFGLFMLYLYVTFGDAFLPLHALAVWNYRFSPLWETLWLELRTIFWGDPGTLANNLLDLGATLFTLALLIWGLLPKRIEEISFRGWKPRIPLIFGLYGLVMIFVPLSMVAYASNFLLVPMASAARRAVVIFPAFMAAGIVLQGHLRALLYVALALALQLILVYVFVNWLWVD